jgi:HSP20 family protein
MDYIKIRFCNDVDKLHSKIEKSIEDVFRSMNPTFSLTERTWYPQIDIYETEEEIIVRAEVAGVDIEDLSVEVSHRAIKLMGKRSELPRIGNATYRLAEIQYGKFERVLYLPVPIDTEIVSTSYTNGFLEIRLVKRDTQKAYKITISESS